VLVRYGCTGLPLTAEQDAVRARCNEALNDITRFYNETLKELGYLGRPFESWAQASECVNMYFEQPEVIQTDYVEVWTEKMKYNIYKLRTRASGGAQLIPDQIHDEAWNRTNGYAIEKYGPDYMNMPGYSKYTGPLLIYKIKH
jgi:hypothetical protein